MVDNRSKVTINVKRIKQFGETTLGKLTIEGVNKSWFVLEPGGPDSKVENSDKRIAAGAYKVKPFTGNRYKNVYELKNVPGRKYILIHPGNYHKNTEGCLMAGKTWGVLKDSHFYVGNSKAAIKEIFSEMSKYQDIEIKITNQLES
ncbi:DUF5675 family protein [Photobacterium sanguinicancri]|uniref:DUF5675 family protein n=1 Tax=Photobacterium sanguinicancri TaxID=875932 RepID=UPI003D14A977